MLRVAMKFTSENTSLNRRFLNVKCLVSKDQNSLVIVRWHRKLPQSSQYFTLLTRYHRIHAILISAYPPTMFEPRSTEHPLPFKRPSDRFIAFIVPISQTHSFQLKYQDRSCCWVGALVSMMASALQFPCKERKHAYLKSMVLVQYVHIKVCSL